jgi:hypothetical protein
MRIATTVGGSTVIPDAEIEALRAAMRGPLRFQSRACRVHRDVRSAARGRTTFGAPMRPRRISES